MITLYGIPNCDRVRAARQWLQRREIPYSFHDVRVDGLTPAQVQDWIDQVGLDTLINRRSKTWRQLTPGVRSQMTPASAIELILAQPTLLKRPLLETRDDLILGFDAEAYAPLLESECV